MTWLVYQSATSKIDVDEHGNVFAKRYPPVAGGGAPIHVIPVPIAISGWRARIPAARRHALVASFAAARAVKTMFPAIPDERPPTLTLGNESIECLRSALDGNIALDRVVSEICAVGSVLFDCGPTDRLVMPEPTEWEKFKSGNPPRGPDAPAPQPGAMEAAQAAIDRFYASHLDALLADVVERSKARAPKTIEKELGDAERVFRCDATGAPAGKITFRLPPGFAGAWLELTGFSATSDVKLLVEDRVALIHHAVVNGDARTLYEHDIALAPFYCPQCNRNYAPIQWSIYAMGAGRAEGLCPANHRKPMARA